MNAATPMTDMAAIRAYIYGCKREATFTLMSKKTGARFTFRLRRDEGKTDFFFADVLTGDDNEGDFTFLGTIAWRRIDRNVSQWGFRYSAASPFPSDAPSILALDWFATLTNYDRALDPAKLEFWHSGRCSRCGRKLTVPESLADGLGPVCRAKAATVLANRRKPTQCGAEPAPGNRRAL